MSESIRIYYVFICVVSVYLLRKV